MTKEYVNKVLALNFLSDAFQEIHRAEMYLKKAGIGTSEIGQLAEALHELANKIQKGEADEE